MPEHLALQTAVAEAAKQEFRGQLIASPSMNAINSTAIIAGIVVLDAIEPALQAFINTKGETWKTIRIVDPSDQTKGAVVCAVREALRHVEQIDPLRFMRLKREVRVVINAPAKGGFGYLRSLEICKITFDFVRRIREAKLGIHLLACILVNAVAQEHRNTRRPTLSTRSRDRMVAWLHSWNAVTAPII